MKKISRDRAQAVEPKTQQKKPWRNDTAQLFRPHGRCCGCERAGERKKHRRIRRGTKSKPAHVKRKSVRTNKRPTNARARIQQPKNRDNDNPSARKNKTEENVTRRNAGPHVIVGVYSTPLTIDYAIKKFTACRMKYIVSCDRRNRRYCTQYIFR